MIIVVGVRFRKSGKVYYFDPANLDIKKGQHVIVETTRGVEYGTVVLASKEVTDDKITTPLKSIMRIATEKDEQTNIENEEKENEAYKICLEKIEKHGLKMKLIDSEYTFDKNKLLFYFTADGRIDFRELVKDLASIFRTRIELRQIGVRDETKMLGGLGMCGRPLCCHSYLSDFVPVSIKMAKEQNLSLNPAKISGVCGRLMCCLKNEQEAYEYLNRSLPHINTIVTTADGYTGEVQSVSVLKQLVKVLIEKDGDEKEVREYPVTELKFKNKNNKKSSPVGAPLPEEEIDENELKELLNMEEKDLEDLSEEEQNTNKKPNQGNRHPKGNGNRQDRFKNQKGPKRDSDKKDFKNGKRDNFNKRNDKRNDQKGEKGKNPHSPHKKNYNNNPAKHQTNNFSQNR